jgi:hypothetical protein
MKNIKYHTVRTVQKFNRKIPHCNEQFKSLIEKYHTVMNSKILSFWLLQKNVVHNKLDIYLFYSYIEDHMWFLNSSKQH